MNYTLIILGIILVILIYILYMKWFRNGALQLVDLTSSNSSIGYDTLSSPTATRFSYCLWAYVDELNPTGNTDIINVKTGDGSPFFSLFVTNQAVLQYRFRLKDASLVTNEIMTNFPLQKWVYVIVSVDNQVIDLYIDGKLTRSQQIDKALTSTNTNFIISYGTCTNGCKGYVANFERLADPMDPSTAWDKYMKGNGGNSFSRMLSSYGATFTLTRDGVKEKQLTLL